MSSTGTDLCRITVVGPQRRMDISLPVAVPFAQLFPAILRYSGENLADAGLAHGGWVLQRLDEAPFDGGSTPSQAGLRDGEVLYLRPGLSQLPELAFDDVADVVANGVNERPDRWRPEWTRNFALGVAAGASVAADVILLLSGPDWAVPAAVAGLLAVLLLGAGVVGSWTSGDTGAATVLSLSALPAALLAGLFAPAGHTPLGHFESVEVLAALSATVLVSVIAAAGIPQARPTFVGAVFASAMGTIGAAIAVLFPGADPVGIVAITAAVTLALTPLSPTVAFRLARVVLPPVPTSAADLRRDTLTVDGAQLLRRTVVADRVVTGITLGLGLVGLVGVVPLALDSGWLGPVTAGVVSLCLLLRSRLFRGRIQRLALLVPGGLGLGFLAVSRALAADGQSGKLVAALVPLVVFAAVFAAVGLWLPGHRPSPFWARATDILDLTIVLALLPLALGLTGLYGYVRGQAGG